MAARKYFDEELSALQADLERMCSITERMIDDSINALKEGDVDLGASVSEMDKEVDELELSIEKRCMRILLRQQPVARDLVKVTTALKVITDLERIGDQAADVGEIVRQFPQDGVAFGTERIQKMGDIAVAMVHQSVEAFIGENEGAADMVIRADDEMDDLFCGVKADLIALMTSDATAADRAVNLLMVAKYLEKIGDYAVNVSEWAKYLTTGEHKEYQ
ncbi:MAG: phosphate signaling complex protein PhoU [Clostridia bacterium]|nr:phosphate signaling complex protein PhoU [Clostridia bacterium]